MMPMKYRKISRSVKCPYYRFDHDVRLVCEGITQDMNTINLVFPDRERLLQHRREQCSRCWEDCPIKGLVDRKRESAERGKQNGNN
jgi:hypothetical protein